MGSRGRCRRTARRARLASLRRFSRSRKRRSLKMFPKYGTFAFPEKPCSVCNTLFTPKSGSHRFCSDKCKGKWQYISGRNSTENQYKKITGNWRRYFPRLLGMHKRKQDGLTVNFLLELLEKQNGKCALSGETLTCNLSNGNVCFTNASVDRIIPGGPYSPDNVRLVCRAVNTLRLVHSDTEFVAWCQKVVDYHAKRT